MKVKIVGSLTLLSIVLGAPAVLAQTPEAAPASPGPFAAWAARGGNFGAAGQFAISGELELSVVKQRGGSTTLNIQPALDYFIATNISVGGVVGLAVTSGSPGVTRVLIGGRAGYNLAIAERITLWPTAGLFFEHDSAGTVSGSSTLLRIVAPFLFHPVQHLFVGFGPFVELGLSGGGDRFGLQSVVGGWI
ncbi:MAG TPA: hypothetical protein VFH73_29005 [Polyangia bacterium]|jgi:hypothetical protein|nr:hypothetical protein [Polyangia bacterium]